MNQDVLHFIVEKTHELMNAPSCSSEAKAAAQSWLDAVGSARETDETVRYLAELEADIMPIDNLIAFAQSQGGQQYFGIETADKIAVHAKEIKAAGAKFCDCPACAACAAILEKKERMLA